MSASLEITRIQMMHKEEKTRLSGFNNLTKTLSFNIYDVCHASSDETVKEYTNYINEKYNADRLATVLERVANIIGANILNLAKADYDPTGASVALLISEELPALAGVTNSKTPGPTPEALVAHLDKSHLTAHTYPETHSHKGLCTFRADIDVSTCGMISPLKALNFLIHSFESDIVIMDYRVRGFTRDTSGEKMFIDHDINSIQNFIDDETKNEFQILDVNIPEENLFHTKMMRKNMDINNYLFKTNREDLSDEEQHRIEQLINTEIEEIFNGKKVN